MQINGVIAHNRFISADGRDVHVIDAHVIDNLGGANIFATTVLARCNKKDPNNGDFIAAAFFSEFTDSAGVSHEIGGGRTTSLFLNGVNSVTHVTGAINADVDSVTTVWLVQEQF